MKIENERCILLVSERTIISPNITVLSYILTEINGNAPAFLASGAKINFGSRMLINRLRCRLEGKMSKSNKTCGRNMAMIGIYWRCHRNFIGPI